MTNKGTEETEEAIRALAEALRAGGTLLHASCPQCNTPLIKIGDKIYCKYCNKEVIIYKEESELPLEIREALKKQTLQKTRSKSPVEKTIKRKVEGLRKKLEKTEDPEEIVKLSEAIDSLLDTLRKIESEE